jgi:hypothetical protein
MALFDRLPNEVRGHPEFVGFKEGIVQKSNKYDS